MNQTIIILSLFLFVIFSISFLFQSDSDSYSFRLSNTANIVYDCQLPSIDPWDSTIHRYLNRDANPLKDCKPTRKILTNLFDGVLFISNVSLFKLGITQYRCLYPIDDYNLNYGNWTILNGTDSTTKGGVRPNCDIVEVQTTNANGSITYRHLHTQIFVQNDGDTLRRKNDSIYRPSVFILVFDSTSSSEGFRSLAETMQILTVDYEAVHFRYLNKVGLNSQPNAHAMLFGERVHPIGKSIYGEAASKLPDRQDFCTTYLNMTRFVGDYFRNASYVSMIAEDWALGAFNWPNCRGFKQTPTTHYMRPFQLRSDPDSKRYYDGKLRLALSTELCREWHEYVIDYVKSFHLAYPSDQPKWSLVWLSHLAHESVNGLYHVDGYFTDLFVQLKPLLADSFVIVMGDHGLRFGGIRSTNAGQIEDNNPMLTIAVPKKLRVNQQLMENLRHNSRQLISHYDLYATLIDIASIAPESKWTNLSNYNFEPIIGNRRGSSLIRRLPPPERRNCETMEIPFEYCICQLNSTRIANITDDPIVIAAGKYLTDQLNKEIADANVTKKCQTLHFSQLHRAEMVVYRTTIMYKVHFSVDPGGGQFEGSVRLPNQQSSLFELMSDTIRRLNRYDKDGDCVRDNSRLRPMCYCNNSGTK